MSEVVADTVSERRIAFVFPGQGAQAVGMGKSLYDSSPAARMALDACEKAFGGGLLALCFDGPDDALKETKNTQPALFAVSLAALAAVSGAGIAPVAAAGHSIGEYAALYAGGAFDLETGMRLVMARANAMQTAATERQGAMAAVLGLDAETVMRICAGVDGAVVAANHNAPGQIVISGEAGAVDAAGAALKAAGAKRVIALTVSGAFHSTLMQSAADALVPILADASISALRVPVVANVTADYETDAPTIRQNLAAQVAGPVRWTETVQRLMGDGVTHFVECGTGNVLAGLIKRIAPEAKTLSVGDADSLSAALSSLGAAG